MLGDVPISVTSPPSSEAKDIGMSSRPGDTPVRRAIWSATGIIIASAPTFLVTIEMSMVMMTSTGTCACSVLSLGRSGRIAASTTPERAIAALTTSAAPMIITISFENPSNARLAGTTPISTPASSTPSDTRS